MNLKAKKRLDLWIGASLIALLRPCVVLLGHILRRDHRIAPRRNLLVIKMMGGGSLVIALPALLGLRKMYSDLEFRLVTTRALEPFAQSLGIFDQVILVDDRSLFRVIWTGLGAIRRCLGSDTLVDLEVHSFLTTVFGLFTLARNRVGFYLESAFWKRGIFTHLIFFNRSSGVYYFYEEIALRMGASPATFDECRSHLRSVNRISGEAEPGIAIGHACSDMGRERMLTPEQWKFAFVSGQVPLSKKPGKILFLGGPTDRKLADRIIEAVREILPPDWTVHNRCGELTLTEALRELARCDTFAGVDSALLHYARVFGLRCISFWGPTAPETRLKAFPRSREEKSHYTKTPCSPCIHVAEEPPCHGENRCIQALFQPTREHPLFHSYMEEPNGNPS